MSEVKTIKIDNVDYNIDEFSDQAKAVFDHVVDLEHKVKIAQFNLVQLQFSLNAFVTQLKTEITSK